jgi:pimeloyl-ACP methyl ester carboxylesterase
LLSAPEVQMLRANRNLRRLLALVSTSRIARPLMVARPSALERIDRFYYSAENVDRETINRFYGFTLEDPGPGALQQLDPYLEHGRLVSADRTVDYSAHLDRVVVPTLFVAGQGDVLAPLESVEWTYQAVGSPDKTLATFGTAHGHRADYGHCDLVWSRHAPKEVFPVIADWLDRRQVRPTPQARPSAQIR